jgi:MerR family transcriptional regulator/heat shock protein HspR
VQSKPRYRMISWVAERYNVHPQTLRLWEREGLLQPARSKGNTRMYDDDACNRLETVLSLTRDLGVNLAGVEIILNLKQQLAKLQAENELLAKMLRKSVQQKSEVPRYHAIVRVESSSIRAVDEE